MDYEIDPSPEQLKEFGDWLHQKITEVGTNQRQLALAMGVNPPAVSHWVLGRRAPSLESVYRLADVLMLDSDEILSRIGKKPPGTTYSFARNELHRLVEELPEADVDTFTRLLRFWLMEAKLVGAAPARRARGVRATAGLPAPLPRKE